MQCLTRHSASEAETERLGGEIVSRVDDDVVLLLEGEMGSGKTVLVRGIADALGVDRREIQSPTYTLIHEHQGVSGCLVHVDLYRLEGDEIESLGLDELLAGPGVKAIEWAERLSERGIEIPGALRVRFRRLSNDEREIVMEPIGALG